MDTYYKLPRLYVETLSQSVATLDTGQVHYLKNVLRLKAGENIRVFNPQAGEFVAAFNGKEAAVGQRLKDAFTQMRRVHLYIPPLPKDRMDFLMEKATELGMTDYHPLLTERAQVRSVKEERLHAQVIEAAEQCERLDIPVIHKPVPLATALEMASGAMMAAVERLDIDYKPLPKYENTDISLFIGPAGGWNDKEKEMLLATTKPLDLGQCILRSETAALVALAGFL